MKLAIITGASRGIGKQTAKIFANQGWKVVNVSRTENPEIDNLLVDLSKPIDLSKLDKLIPLIEDSNEVSLVHCASNLENNMTCPA
jgi:3-oxoacyl-[acyl-carrier protein] reductase